MKQAHNFNMTGNNVSMNHGWKNVGSKDAILIPFNGWGAFIMTLLAAEGFANPFSTMIRAMGYNFYAIIALFLVPLVIWFGWD